MTFISSSEASQANSQILSISQDTIQALALLLKSLFDQKEKEQEKPTQNPDKPPSEVSESDYDQMSNDFDQGIADDWWARYQSIPDPLGTVPVDNVNNISEPSSDIVLSSSDSLEPFDYSPLDTPPSLDSGGQSALSMDDFRQQVMAGVSVALVANFGEDGIYQAEDYLIKSSESSDGQNVYEIFDNQGELMAGFTFDRDADVPADYFIDVSPIDTQIEFTQTAYSTAQIDMVDLADSGYLAAVDALGDLAPAGSRGVILVENALAISGKNDFEGKTYSFHKDSDGDLSIVRNDSKETVLVTEAGHIFKHSLTPTDLAKFKEVFNEMKDATPVATKGQIKDALPALTASKGGIER
jgi:hypothetical protein